MNEIVSISSGDQGYLDQERAVLLFESPWCSGCKNVLKYMEDLSFENDKKCFLGKVDITTNQTLAQQYEVLSLPTLIFFQESLEKDKISGNISKELFSQKIKKLMNNEF